jgi:hypothetical protein
MDFLENADQEKLQRAIFQAVKRKYRLSNSGVIYDVTNTYLYGKKCPLGKLGHDKEGVDGRPLIQIGLGVTQDEGIPVFHKTFDGNIADSRTLHDLITTFAGYNLSPGTIVYDRGITSGRNIADIKALEWETVCGVPLTEPVQKFWRPVVQKGDRLPLADRVQLNRTTFYVTTRPYTIQKVKGTLYLCFNARQQVDLRDSRREEIVAAQQRLRDVSGRSKCTTPGRNEGFQSVPPGERPKGCTVTGKNRTMCSHYGQHTLGATTTSNRQFSRAGLVDSTHRARAQTPSEDRPAVPH